MASLMIGRFGCGLTMVFGALRASLGIGVSSFATGVGQLIASFGFLAGKNMRIKTFKIVWFSIQQKTLS